MKYLVTRHRIYFAEIESIDEIEALDKARKLLEEDWKDDDRPDEYSIESELIEDDRNVCRVCRGRGCLMIFGQDDMPETCPECNGVGKEMSTILLKNKTYRSQYSESTRKRE